MRLLNSPCVTERTSVAFHNLRTAKWIFIKTDVVPEHQFRLISDNNNGHFTWRPACVSEHGSDWEGESPCREIYRLLWLQWFPLLPRLPREFPVSRATTWGNPPWRHHTARHAADTPPAQRSLTPWQSWHNWRDTHRLKFKLLWCARVTLWVHFLTPLFSFSSVVVMDTTCSYGYHLYLWIPPVVMYTTCSYGYHL
jgi:hypothetical protein